MTPQKLCLSAVTISTPVSALANDTPTAALAQTARAAGPQLFTTATLLIGLTLGLIWLAIIVVRRERKLRRENPARRRVSRSISPRDTAFRRFSLPR